MEEPTARLKCGSHLTLESLLFMSTCAGRILTEPCDHVAVFSMSLWFLFPKLIKVTNYYHGNFLFNFF